MIWICVFLIFSKLSVSGNAEKYAVPRNLQVENRQSRYGYTPFYNQFLDQINSKEFYDIPTTHNYKIPKKCKDSTDNPLLTIPNDAYLLGPDSGAIPTDLTIANYGAGEQIIVPKNPINIPIPQGTMVPLLPTQQQAIMLGSMPSSTQTIILQKPSLQQSTLLSMPTTIRTDIMQRPVSEQTNLLTSPAIQQTLFQNPGSPTGLTTVDSTPNDNSVQEDTPRGTIVQVPGVGDGDPAVGSSIPLTTPNDNSVQEDTPRGTIVQVPGVGDGDPAVGSSIPLTIQTRKRQSCPAGGTSESSSLSYHSQAAIMQRYLRGSPDLAGGPEGQLSSPSAGPQPVLEPRGTNDNIHREYISVHPIDEVGKPLDSLPAGTEFPFGWK